MARNHFRYCPDCGNELVSIERGGRDRTHCELCGRTWYRNPTTGVAVIVVEADRVLMGRRSRGPYMGQWCIPCGHVEWDEDIRDAAQREFAEETGLTVNIGKVYAAHSNFHDELQHTVGVWFLGEPAGGALAAADDIDEIAFFPLHEPFPKLAYETDRLVLEQLCADHSSGRLKTLLSTSSQ